MIACSPTSHEADYGLVLIVDESAPRYCTCDLPVDEIASLAENYGLEIFWMGDYVGLGTKELSIKAAAPSGWALALIELDYRNILYLGKSGNELSSIYISSL